MKIRILLTFIALYGIVASCSKDENEIRTDIIGTWQFSKSGVVENGMTNDTSSDCAKKSTITFTNTGKVTSVDYYIEQETQNCVLFTNNESFVGKWEKTSKTNYRIFYENEDGSQGYESAMSSVEFPDNDTMYFYSLFTGGDEVFRDEYIRID
jgi:hypothetical protein